MYTLTVHEIWAARKPSSGVVDVLPRVGITTLILSHGPIVSPVGARAACVKPDYNSEYHGR